MGSIKLLVRDAHTHHISIIRVSEILLVPPLYLYSHPSLPAGSDERNTPTIKEATPINLPDLPLDTWLLVTSFLDPADICLLAQCRSDTINNTDLVSSSSSASNDNALSCKTLITPVCIHLVCRLSAYLSDQ